MSNSVEYEIAMDAHREDQEAFAVKCKLYMLAEDESEAGEAPCPIEGGPKLWNPDHDGPGVRLISWSGLADAIIAGYYDRMWNGAGKKWANQYNNSMPDHWCGYEI